MVKKAKRDAKVKKTEDAPAAVEKEALLEDAPATSAGDEEAQPIAQDK
jgi:hypothetical protein